MTQSQATKDLAIKNYSGKWKQAQLLVAARVPPSHPDYWERVRSTYLALGGLIISQLKPKQQALYFKGYFEA